MPLSVYLPNTPKVSAQSNHLVFLAGELILSPKLFPADLDEYANCVVLVLIFARLFQSYDLNVLKCLLLLLQ